MTYPHLHYNGACLLGGSEFPWSRPDHELDGENWIDRNCDLPLVRLSEDDEGQLEDLEGLEVVEIAEATPRDHQAWLQEEITFRRERKWLL